MHVWFTNCEQSRKNLKSIQHFCFQNIKPFKTLQSVKCRSISRSWQEYSNLWNAQWLLRRVEHAPGGRRKACWASVRMGSRKKWFIMSTFKLGICGIRYWSDCNLERTYKRRMQRFDIPSISIQSNRTRAFYIYSWFLVDIDRASRASGDLWDNLSDLVLAYLCCMFTRHHNRMWTSRDLSSGSGYTSYVIVLQPHSSSPQKYSYWNIYITIQWL